VSSRRRTISFQRAGSTEMTQWCKPPRTSA
jgi:hypothetical protein